MSDFLRRTRLADAADAVQRAARFRLPQAQSFERLTELVEHRLPDDLPRIPQRDVDEAVRGMGIPVQRSYPELYFALATGVGKRRLMGASAAYLYAARQSRNMLILAPRDAILRKLEREALAGSDPDYLLLDGRIVPVPNVCTRDNLESFEPDSRRLNLFILSPQTLVGTDRRISKARPYSSVRSLSEYLRACPDLIIFSDEAHHIGDEGAAWRAGVDALEPKLYLAYTATPQPGQPTAYTYDLAACLRDGLYTKAVELYTKKRDDLLDDDAWERVTLDYAVGRLKIKEAAFDAYRVDHPSWPAEPPVLLLTCRDREHAEEVGRLMTDRYGFDSETEVIVTHSGRRRAEVEVERIVELDAPGNRARVVVQVQQLTEGWDVRRVYVMAPLRTMGTFQYAIQNLGRGLRLPVGERIGEQQLDTLDVVLFGRESAAEIIDRAREQFGDPETGSAPIEVTEAGDEPEQPVARIDVSQDPREVVEWSWPTVRRIPESLDLDFDPDLPEHALEDIVTRVVLGDAAPSAEAAKDAARYSVEELKRAVVPQVCRQLEFLDELTDRPGVERLIDRLLAKMDLDQRAGNQIAQVYVAPERLTAFLVSELIERRRSLPARFEATGQVHRLRLEKVRTIVPDDGRQPADQRQVAT